MDVSWHPRGLIVRREKEFEKCSSFLLFRCEACLAWSFDGNDLIRVQMLPTAVARLGNVEGLKMIFPW